MTFRRQASVGVVDEDPSVEVVPPVRKRFSEVSLNLADGFRRPHLVRRIDLEQGSFRPQITIVLSVTDVSPRPTGDEISRMRLRHDGNEQVLESRGLRFEKLRPKLQLVKCSGLLIHARLSLCGKPCRV